MKLLVSELGGWGLTVQALWGLRNAGLGGYLDRLPVPRHFEPLGQS